jgi:type I restriction enzyme, R subunit
MWLTGFDAPCVNTMYIDKPMQGHNLMQAIARVNRVFRDKPGGLIVDFIGIADPLREATRKYSAGGGRGDLVEDLTDRAVDFFLTQLEAALSNLPPDGDYAGWRDRSPVELDDLTSACYGTLLDEQAREDFLADEHRLSKAFSLIAHLPAGRDHADEVAFCQMIRGQLRKLNPLGHSGREDLERAVRDLGLSDEELALFDVVRLGAEVGLPGENEWIAALVHDVVRAVRANLKVDWTKAHRKDVQAGVESAVKLVLRRRRIKGEQFQFLLHRLMQQAEASYEDWPLAA